MIESANVTILVNNWVDESRLWAEHGLSLLIEYREAGHRGQILLDVGQSGTVLAHNLSRLGLALDCLEYVVLSHGHYDHTDGLDAIRQHLGPRVGVVVHPRAWGVRYNLKRSSRQVGSALSPGRLAAWRLPLVDGETALPLSPKGFIQTTGTIERGERIEEDDSLARETAEGRRPDAVVDDLSVVLNLGERGLFLLCGCCHAGLMNTVRHAKRATGNGKLLGVIGGLHLQPASATRIDATVDFLAGEHASTLVPLHCSGWQATCALRARLGEAVRYLGAGDTVRLL